MPEIAKSACTPKRFQQMSPFPFFEVGRIGWIVRVSFAFDLDVSFDGRVLGEVQPDFIWPPFVIAGFAEEGPVPIPAPRKVFRVLHENLEKRVIYAGLAVLSDLSAAVAVAVGMWKPASFAGFQAPRAGRTIVADVPSFRPRSAISTARPRFIGHSGENLLLGDRRSGNGCL